MTGNILKFILGMLFAPTVILLHESSHYLTARALGLTPAFHAAKNTFQVPKEGLSERKNFVVTIAGPLVEATLGSVGICWLWRLRSKRRMTPATAIDWLATFFAICAGRWLRCVTGTPTHPQPGDEARLSADLGLPHWFLPYFLAPFSLLILGTAIYLHPTGSRLIPFASVILGGCVGSFLWVNYLGPRLLP